MIRSYLNKDVIINYRTSYIGLRGTLNMHVEIGNKGLNNFDTFDITADLRIEGDLDSPNDLIDVFSFKISSNPKGVNVNADSDRYNNYFSYRKQGILYTFSSPRITRNVSIKNPESLKIQMCLFVGTQPFTVVNGKEIYRSTRDNNPVISIISQLLIDESDIGQTIFTVTQPNMIFNKNCPKIVNVLKGKGNTMWEKLNYLYVIDPPGVLGLDFLSNIVQYSMLKYVLSKLLYGKFNKKYILNKYQNKLLKDLAHSKYNYYLAFFTTGNTSDYNKYFLYDYKDIQ
jgi:hypothetical protein